MGMDSLAGKLFCQGSILNWTIRRKIGIGIARFLAYYLHNDHSKRFLNIRINAANVYLDERFTPKLGDFESIIMPSEGSSESLSLALQFEEFRNVQDIGVLLLELLTGRRWAAMDYSLQYIQEFIQRSDGDEFFRELLLDRVLEGNVEMEEAMTWVRVALWCFAGSPSEKPNMNMVVVAMEGGMLYLPNYRMFKGYRPGQEELISRKAKGSNRVLTHMWSAWVDLMSHEQKKSQLAHTTVLVLKSASVVLVILSGGEKFYKFKMKGKCYVF